MSDQPVPVSYSEWILDESTGALKSIVTRTDTGEVIGTAERVPELPEDPAKVSAKAKLAKLGLTEAEIEALIG